MHRSLIAIVSILILLPLAAFGDPVVTHRLAVTLTPASGGITARDEITLPRAMARERLDLRLHPALTITRIRGGQLTTVAPGRHELAPNGEGEPIVIEYRGRIRHPLTDISDATGKQQHVTQGWIGDDGVFLDGGSGWYPQIGGHPIHFELSVRLPAGWQAVSQGRRIARNHWRDDTPQQEIYLIAGRYHRYATNAGPATAEVYLRQPDDKLARRYLEATKRHLADYGRLLGPYPYPKFALIENFWESGYGMPSFTLLGPTVIRLPFIIHTAYPHEIVHNWLGNGVYVDWAQGNWSEGLTTYLADHRLREQQGTAAVYRRDQLKSWADHAGDEGDFPLVRFTARHGDASQAVGYAKAMMFFHTIRKRIGDDAFHSGLKRFVANKRFQTASYDDLRRHWEASSGIDLDDIFAQWLHRTGAPRLALRAPRLIDEGERFRFTAVLVQTDDGPTLPLVVPLHFRTDDGMATAVRLITATERRTPIDLLFRHRPLSVAVDPEFDCFRQLLPEETPTTLSTILGAEKVVVVLPARADAPLLARYRALAERWASKHGGLWKITTDTEIDALPGHDPAIVLGWENRFATGLRGKAAAPEALDRSSDSYVQAVEPTPGAAVLFIASHRADAIDGLARKLPHYGKYSFLRFTGDEPRVVEKGEWPSRTPAMVLGKEPPTPGRRTPGTRNTPPTTAPPSVPPAR